MAFEEADYGITEMAFARAGNNGMRPGDETLLVRFLTKPRENATASAEAGRPIYEDVDYIEIRIPGARDVAYCQPATSIDKARFPEHWRLYKARMSQETVSGTPLAEWPGITRAQVEELRFVNVTTLEQLIAMSDTHAQRFMGVRALQQKAKAYLEVAGNQAAANALDETRRQLQEQQVINQKLLARLEALEELRGGGDAAPEAPRRRGRPPAQEA